MTSYAPGLHNYYIFTRFVAWVANKQAYLLESFEEITKFGSISLIWQDWYYQYHRVGWFMV